MNEQQQAAMRQALEAICGSGDFLFNWHDCEPNNEREIRRYQATLADNEKAFKAIREALAEQPAQQQEPGAFPPVQFEKVAEGVEVGYDMLGGVDIRLGGEFVYVHINYDYRYTHNAARKALADQIVGLLTSPPASKPWVGLTEEEIEELNCLNIMWDDGESAEIYNIEAFARAIEAKLREKNGGAA